MKKLLLLVLLIACFKANKSIDFKNKDINEELFLAIAGNDAKKALKLINQGANVNFVYDNRSFLDLALANKNLPILKILLQKGLETNKNNIVKIYDLALEDFDYEMIDLIKDKYKLEQGLVDESKYFLFLCYTSTAYELKSFIEENNINPKEIKDKINRNGLIISAFADKIDIFKMLIEEYKLNINQKNDYDVTALIAASNRSSKELLEFIIEKEANINSNQKGGLTALMIASANGRNEIVELLLDKGANINHKDKDGNTALMSASSKGHGKTAAFLIQKGASIVDKQKDGCTAIIIASQNGHKEVVNLLLKNGANINDKQKDGFTALMIASKLGHIEIVKILIE